MVFAFPSPENVSNVHILIILVFRMLLGKLYIVSNRYVKAGEELTISYVECTNPENPTERQTRLYRQYGFTCDCSFCSLQKGYRQTKFDALNQRFLDLNPKINVSDTRMIPLLRRIIKETKKAYQQHLQTKMLALSFLLQSKGLLKDSLDIHKDIFGYYTNITDVDAYLKGRHKSNDGSYEDIIFNVATHRRIVKLFQSLGDSAD